MTTILKAKPRNRYVTIEDCAPDRDHTHTVRNAPVMNGTEITLQQIPATKQYRACLKIKQATGYPKHYENDLFLHDRAALWNWEPQKFIWIVRDTGTWIVFEKHGFETLRYCTERSIKGMEQHSFYLYDNGTMQQCSPREADEFFRENLLDVECEKYGNNIYKD